MEKKVKKIRLPGTDLEVSPIGLGTWQFAGGHGFNKYIWPNEIPEETRIGIVKAALDGGINWFDTAEAYGGGRSERNLAAALQAAGKKDGDVIIATKWLPMMRFAGNIRKTIKNRIAALEPYSIDLYQIHQPTSFSTTRSQMNTMADLVESGKIRSVGVSNFSKKKMVKAYDALKDRGLQLVSNQVHYSLVHRNIEKNGLLETAKELGIKIIAWGPLEQGVLTGKYHKDLSLAKNVSFIRRRITPNIIKKTKKSKALMEAIEEIAKTHEVTATQIALNWVINFHGDTILAIPGASKVHHVEQNVGAMYFELSKDEMTRIDELSREYNKLD
ncbi:MAG TPA: aldo/keto reductase [Candidatus Deferrimicrobium sp.]|nr:aldo/keto reductase [Candidatus Deferrimicrobium sp.]